MLYFSLFSVDAKNLFRQLFWLPPFPKVKAKRCARHNFKQHFRTAPIRLFAHEKTPALIRQARVFVLFSIEGILIHEDGSVFGFIFPDTGLRQVFQLGIQRSFVVLGNVGYFIEKLRFKTDSGLHLVRCHDNTSFAI